ncbi:hypothetical protein GCM10023191_085330 [Actinoallomurus oryzae]|uniref:DUF4242 domain-containing protein n=2 Tax=Actinoallomurus oryzae TaxID=502180 RepID=A0ABP8R1M1_9ACTN
MVMPFRLRCLSRPQVKPAPGSPGSPGSSGDPYGAAGDWSPHPAPERSEEIEETAPAGTPSDEGSPMAEHGIDDAARTGVPSGEGGPLTVYLSIGLPADAMPGGLARIQHSLAAAADRMTRSGHPVRYMNGMYMPAETRLLCVFTAESEEAVHAAVRLLRLPFVQLKAVADDQNPAPETGEPDR